VLDENLAFGMAEEALGAAGTPIRQITPVQAQPFLKLYGNVNGADGRPAGLGDVA
jgi:hypothetical protein